MEEVSLFPILHDNPVSIWNDLQPQRWNNSLLDTYPGFIMIAVFTIGHLFADWIISGRAHKYAQEEMRSKYGENHIFNKNWKNGPKWLSKEFVNDLTLIKVKSRKKKKHKVIDGSIFDKLLKKHNINVTIDKKIQGDILRYHKQLEDHNQLVMRFNENFFKVVLFGPIYIYGLFFIFNFDNSRWFWTLCSNDINTWPQSNLTNISNVFNLNNYYWVQIGYHGHRALFQFFEYSRKDFVAMFIHHWLTLLLLLGSYCAGYQESGAKVLLCNDNIDLFLPMAKLCGYLGFTNMRTLFFLLFALLWVPFRIIGYFILVLWEPFNCLYFEQIRPYLLHWILLFGVWIIYFLQVYWAQFVLGSLYRSLKGEKMTDGRSDHEDKIDNTKDKEN